MDRPKCLVAALKFSPGSTKTVLVAALRFFFGFGCIFVGVTKSVFVDLTNTMQILIEHWPFVAFVVAVFALLLLSRFFFGSEPMPYEKREALVTETELEFYQVLSESAGEDWAIFAMVRIADLIRVIDETPKRLSWQNRINCKHIDFVLCDPESLIPQVAIELDDRSHQRADRKERDRFVNEAMDAAGLPLLRVKVRSEYDADHLRQRIEDAAA